MQFPENKTEQSSPLSFGWTKITSTIIITTKQQLMISGTAIRSIKDPLENDEITNAPMGSKWKECSSTYATTIAMLTNIMPTFGICEVTPMTLMKLSA